MFNDENSLIRLDMSEYMEKHSISKMIGSLLAMLAMKKVVN